MSRWSGRVWVEYRRTPPGARVVCSYCHTRGEWGQVGTMAAARTAHEAICAPWWEFCDLWNAVAWEIGRQAPYYWSSIHPPGRCRCGHQWEEHREGRCTGGESISAVMAEVVDRILPGGGK